MPSTFQIACPHCQRTLRVPEKAIDRIATCSACRKQFQVKGIGGNTLLARAGVSGSAPTELHADPSSQVATELAQKQRPRKRRLLILLALAAIVFAGCGGLAVLTLWTWLSPSIYDQKELQSELTAATVKEVRSKLGTPDQVEIDGMVTGNPISESQSTWTYRRKTRNPQTKDVENTRITLWILDGRVTQVFFHRLSDADK